MTFEEMQAVIEGMLSVQRELQERQLNFDDELRGMRDKFDAEMREMRDEFNRRGEETDRRIRELVSHGKSVDTRFNDAEGRDIAQERQWLDTMQEINDIKRRLIALEGQS